MLSQGRGIVTSNLIYNCIHAQLCDTIKNINKEAFESMARAAAYTVDVSYTFVY